MIDKLMPLLIIGAGGFFGAIARYVVGMAVQNHIKGTFPWGTFVINVTGSFVLGFIGTLLANRFLVSANWRYFVTIGFIGAYTTFSTFEYETANLGSSWQAMFNLLGSVVVGYIAVWLGIRLGEIFPARI